MKNRLEELCDCAFEQGYGKIKKKAPGVYLPNLSWRIYERLKEILLEEES